MIKRGSDDPSGLPTFDSLKSDRIHWRKRLINELRLLVGSWGLSFALWALPDSDFKTAYTHFLKTNLSKLL